MEELSHQTMLSRSQSIQKGIKIGIPLAIGYVPVALTYGVLAQQAGLSIIELTLMSVLVFAGASQFMAVNMIVAGISAVEIIIATFVLNLRHFVLSLSLMNEFRNHIPLKSRAALTLGLTDESFAVSALNKEEREEKHGVLFFSALYLVGYLSWIGGSVAGGVLGEVIPSQLSQSMGVALYALFIGLLVPAVKKEIKFAMIAIIAMLLNGVLDQFVSEGWAIVSSIVLGSFFGIFILKDEES